MEPRNSAERSLTEAEKAMARYLYARGALEVGIGTMIAVGIMAGLLCILP